MKNKLKGLVVLLRDSATTLEQRIHSATSDELSDVLTPDPGTVSQEIRGIIFKVFRAAADIIGRSGYASVIIDTRERVNRLFSSGGIPMYMPAIGGKIVEDAESWIKRVIAPRLDSDMTTPSREGEIAAFHLSVYKDTGDNPWMKRFYDALSYFRRNQPHDDSSRNTQITARPYTKKVREANN